MDFQNRAGSKPGSGGVAGASESNVDRRERLRKLALETIDLAKDPYFMKNHLGSYECKLCLTLHNDEGSYLAHTQGKKHQTNLARRAAREAKDTSMTSIPGLVPVAPVRKSLQLGTITPKKIAVKIGRPGYKVTKIRDPFTRMLGLLFQIQYPEIGPGVKPRHRFMSAFEQKVEEANRAFQYLLFAAEPYETVAFKVQSREIDRHEGRFWTHWDQDGKQFTLQFFFKTDKVVLNGPPTLAPGTMIGPPAVTHAVGH
ncbi:Splicing factor 3A subunit 2 [Nowakowskiella sp. JEL0407]|nr:Splicing factor 3A subunit 2 [Nowakowskiella sp. JEL0407]